MIKNFINFVKEVPSTAKKTFKEWIAEDPFDKAAVVAYYSIFSLPALLIILIAIAGTFFGKDAVQGQIVQQISSVIGKESAEAVQGMIANAYKAQASVLATIIGIGTLLIGATGVFIALQTGLNSIWDVKPNPQGSSIKRLIKVRALSFGLILAIGFLLMVSLVVSTLLTAFSDWIMTLLPDFMIILFQIINNIISFLITTLLFGILFKYLPDAKIEWRSVWPGAAITSLLFTLAKFALSFYFGKAAPGSTYGSAGAIILLLLWVSYSCLILFFGAQFTQVYAAEHGHSIEPSPDAIQIEEVVKEVKPKKSSKKAA